MFHDAFIFRKKTDLFHRFLPALFGKRPEGVQQHVQPLDLLDLAEEEKNRPVLRQRKPFPGFCFGNGAGEVQKMPVRDQGEPAAERREQRAEAFQIRTARKLSGESTGRRSAA